jgi:hypothetical protein
MNHPDTDIADAIIAGMGSADGPTEQMAAIVTNLERAGFVIRPTAEYEALMAAARKCMSDKKASKELANWILGFLSDECSLDPSCVSAADRSNIENAIANSCDGSSENCELCDGLEKHIADLESRLASPLPEEVAGLINAMRKRYDDVLAEPVADALEQQAREIERLHERLEDNHCYEHDASGNAVRVDVPAGSIPDGIDARNETIKIQDGNLGTLRGRIAEQAREIERLTKELSAEYQFQTLLQLRARVKNLETERDAIEAETIERLAERLERTHVSGGLLTPSAAAVIIRTAGERNV